jgi:hypothetical protein
MAKFQTDLLLNKHLKEGGAGDRLIGAEPRSDLGSRAGAHGVRPGRMEGWPARAPGVGNGGARRKGRPHMPRGCAWRAYSRRGPGGKPVAPTSWGMADLSEIGAVLFRGKERHRSTAI